MPPSVPRSRNVPIPLNPPLAGGNWTQLLRTTFGRASLRRSAPGAGSWCDWRIDTGRQVWQDGIAMNARQNQFSLTRTVSTARGRAQTTFLSASSGA